LNFSIADKKNHFQVLIVNFMAYQQADSSINLQGSNHWAERLTTLWLIISRRAYPLT